MDKAVGEISDPRGWWGHPSPTGEQLATKAWPELSAEERPPANPPGSEEPGPSSQNELFRAVQPFPPSREEGSDSEDIDQYFNFDLYATEQEPSTAPNQAEVALPPVADSGDLGRYFHFPGYSQGSPAPSMGAPNIEAPEGGANSAPPAPEQVGQIEPPAPPAQGGLNGVAVPADPPGAGIGPVFHLISYDERTAELRLFLAPEKGEIPGYLLSSYCFIEREIEGELLRRGYSYQAIRSCWPEIRDLLCSSVGEGVC